MKIHCLTVIFLLFYAQVLNSAEQPIPQESEWEQELKELKKIAEEKSSRQEKHKNAFQDISIIAQQPSSARRQEQLIIALHALLKDKIFNKWEEILPYIKDLALKQKLTDEEKIWFYILLDSALSSGVIRGGVANDLFRIPAWREIVFQIGLWTESAKKEASGDIKSLEALSSLYILKEKPYSYLLIRAFINKLNRPQITEEQFNLLKHGVASFINHMKGDLKLQRSAINRIFNDVLSEQARIVDKIAGPRISYVNLVVLFCTQDNGALTFELCDAIDQQEKIIAAKEMLYYLQHPPKAYLKERCDAAWNKLSRWSMYEDESGNFCILLPPSPKSLSEYGFIATLRLAPRDVVQIKKPSTIVGLALQTLKDKPIIDLNNFFKLFDFNRPIDKYIYLSGHGCGEPECSFDSIAEMTIDQTVQLLFGLNALRTKFLSISSCYAGGLNHLFIQDAIENQIKQKLSQGEQVASAGVDYPIDIVIKYPIVLLSSSDVSTQGFLGNRYFIDFFGFLNNWGSARVAAKEKKEAFRDAIRVLFDAASAKALTLPSIRMPGRDTEFILYDKLPSVFVLDYDIREKACPGRAFEKLYKVRPEVSRRQLEQPQPGYEKHLKEKAGKLSEERSEHSKFLHEIRPTIDIPDRASFVVIYPVDLTCATIRITGGAVTMLSKIPGPACHFLNGYESPNLTLDGMIRYFFKDPSLMSRAWFIRELKPSGPCTINNVILSVINVSEIKNLMGMLFATFGFTKGLEGLSVILQRSDNEKYHCLIGKVARKSDQKSGEDFFALTSNYRELSKNEFLLLCNTIFSLTEPQERALIFTKTHFETEESIRAAYEDYMANLGFDDTGLAQFSERNKKSGLQLINAIREDKTARVIQQPMLEQFLCDLNN